jgi:hypothetical protein
MIAKWPRLRRENYSLVVVSEKVKQASTSTVRDLSVVSPDYHRRDRQPVFSTRGAPKFQFIEILSGTCNLAVGGGQRFRAISKIFP